MTKYFVCANSFAAPFFSNTSTGYCYGETPEDALVKFAAAHEHPRGLFAAALYVSADAYHSDERPLAKWLCNDEQERMRRTKGKGAYIMCHHGPGLMTIDGESVAVADPKGGSLVQP